MQQYTLQCTIHKDSSATLPLPPDQHYIYDVAIRSLGADDLTLQARLVSAGIKFHDNSLARVSLRQACLAASYHLHI